MIENLKQIDAFKNLGENHYELIEKNAKRYKYKMGQPLSIKKEISREVQVIVTGTARLIGSEDHKSFTVRKLNKGEIVGLASILNAQAIEEVSAAGELETIAIPDEIILRLYSEDKFFRKWCDTQVQKCEVYQACKYVKQFSRKSLITEKEIYNLIEDISLVRVVTGKSPTTGDGENTWFVSSGNVVGLNIGNVYEDKQLLDVEGPFPLRLIGLPNKKIKELEQIKKPKNSEKQTSNSGEENKGISDAPLIPERTGLELGQNSKNKKVELISGDGESEVRACLEMMCKYLDVPFRDSVKRFY